MQFWPSLSLLVALHICKSVYGSLIDDLVNAITQAVDCDSCHALFVPLKGLAALGNSAFSDSMAAVCKAIGVWDLYLLHNDLRLPSIASRPKMMMSAMEH